MPDPRALLVHPGELGLPTGGYAYDRRMLVELRALGWSVDPLRLEGSFPEPTERERAQACALLASQPDQAVLLVDGLALGALPEIGSFLRAQQVLVALIHHPLALETGLRPEQARRMKTEEMRALTRADAVVCTSQHTAQTLIRSYGVRAETITVAVPGTDSVPWDVRREAAPEAPADAAHDSAFGAPHVSSECRLLAVGSLVPRKGHDLLLSALARLRDLPWRLCIAGDDGLDPATAHALRGQVHAERLTDRVVLLGAVSSARLERLYREADLFVLASRHEGFGMAYAEAIAWGLPVIGTRAGAIPESVPQAAGLLVPPDDREALIKALRSLLSDPNRRAGLAAAARTAALFQARWPASARLISEAMALARRNAAARVAATAQAVSVSTTLAQEPAAESFSGGWLALREPADRRARDPGLLDAVLAHIGGLRHPRITDLGCGSGSTLRTLAARLSPGQAWTLVDHDPALLAAARQEAVQRGLPAAILQLDLHHGLDEILARPADLIVTSAFLDLVSREWLGRFVEGLRRHRLPCYAALSYDGRVALAPEDPLDEPALVAFNLHQLRDKGLGAALGPRAAGVLIDMLQAVGFSVSWARADWVLGAEDSVLQRELLEGWHKAIREVGQVPPDELDAWRERRLALVGQSRSHVRVGHIDLFALPPKA